MMTALAVVLAAGFVGGGLGYYLMASRASRAALEDFEARAPAIVETTRSGHRAVFGERCAELGVTGAYPVLPPAPPPG